MRIKLFGYKKSGNEFKMEHRGVIIIYDKTIYHKDGGIEMFYNCQSIAILTGKTATKFKNVVKGQDYGNNT